MEIKEMTTKKRVLQEITTSIEINEEFIIEAEKVGNTSYIEALRIAVSKLQSLYKAVKKVTPKEAEYRAADIIKTIKIYESKADKHSAKGA